MGQPLLYDNKPSFIDIKEVWRVEARFRFMDRGKCQSYKDCGRPPAWMSGWNANWRVVSFLINDGDRPQFGAALRSLSLESPCFKFGSVFGSYGLSVWRSFAAMFRFDRIA